MPHTFVIAEAGINHNGNLDIAKQLIQGAKEVGADAIKFQKRTLDKVYTKEELDKYRESPWGTTNRDQKAGLEFGEKEYIEIDKYCKQLQIEWFASPWDLESADFLAGFDCKYSKVPSARLSHGQLLQKIAKQQRRTFIGTGMSTLEEIERAVMIFRAYDCPFELLHCNSSYPAEPSELNLYMIPNLRHRFQCAVGYSGHEVGLTPSIVAVSLGATTVERHITLNRSMYGSDQAASVEIQGFRRLIDMIREAEITLGNGTKTITATEQKIREKLWRDRDIVEK